MPLKEISLAITCPACGTQQGERTVVAPTEIKCPNCERDITIDSFGRLGINPQD